MEGGAESLFQGLGQMLGREIMNPAGETRLRGAIREQIAHPHDQFDTAPGVNYSEADRLFLGFGVTQQDRATMINFNEEQAGRWFEIVANEYDQARASGAVLSEISAERWAEIEVHELEHFREQGRRGLDTTKSTLRASFGYDKPTTESPRGIGFELAMIPGDLEKYHQLHSVDKVAILLAPEDPSVPDCLRAINVIRQDLTTFISRPREAIELVGKLRKVTGISFIETLKLLGGK